MCHIRLYLPLNTDIMQSRKFVRAVTEAVRMFYKTARTAVQPAVTVQLTAVHISVLAPSRPPITH